MNEEQKAKFREGWERRDGRLYVAGIELPDGPWHAEQDERVFESFGFACKVLRNANGNWCGYVRIPEGHPWHRLPYDKLNALNLEVHGGLTFSSHGDWIKDGHATPTGAVAWWIGFDTLHAWDLMMLMLVAPKLIPGFPKRPRGTYRTQSYVESETTKLAAQVAAAAIPRDN